MRAARKRVVVVEMEIVWGVWGKCAASPRVFMATGGPRGELSLLKGKKSRPRPRTTAGVSPLVSEKLVFVNQFINIAGPTQKGDVNQRNFGSCSPLCVQRARQHVRHFVLPVSCACSVANWQVIDENSAWENCDQFKL